MKTAYLILLLFIITIASNAQVSFSEKSIDAGLIFTYDDILLMGGGAAVFDFDNDGDEDVYVVGGNNPDGLFENDGSGNFTNVSMEYGIVEQTRGVMTTSVTTGDIDNDGIREIFVGTFGPRLSQSEFSRNLLLHRKDLNFAYVDIAERVNIKDESFCMGGHFADVNRDGLLDLYVMNYVEQAGFITANGEVVGYDHTCGRNRLYINNGNFFFTEKAALYNLVNDGCTLAATTADIDNDRDPDLIIANDFGKWLEPNQLYINAHPSSVFHDVSEPSNVNAQMYAMGIAVADYDEDLDFDFYITNLGANLFFENKGNTTFSEISMQKGLRDEFTEDNMYTTGWGTFFADINNDSYQDLFVANGYVASVVDRDGQAQKDRLFLCRSNFQFDDVSDEAGIQFEGLSRGAVYADFNLDGKLDIITITNDAVLPGTNNFIQYYENTSANQHWVGFDLEGQVSNKDAYDTKAILYFNGRQVLKAIAGGASHASQNSSKLHFGIGTAVKVDSITFLWPSGIDQTIENPAIDRYHKVVENEPLTSVQNQGVPIGDVKLFPNPVSQQLNYKMSALQDDSQLVIAISSMDGRLVRTWRKMPSKGTINVTGFTPGLYSVSFNDGGKIFIKKVRIQ